MIVLNDVNFEDIIINIIGVVFGFVGECCMVCVVVMVEEGIVDEFMVKLQEKVVDIKIGNGFDDGVFLGLVICEDNKKCMFSYIEKGLEEGVRFVCDGCENVFDDGYFVGLMIFDNVMIEMMIWKDEIFVLVLFVICVKNLKEVIEIVNKFEFVNGVCLFIFNLNVICYFCENIDVGMFGINLGVLVLMVFFLFLGWKFLFFGMLYVNGKDSVDFYMCKKVVIVRYLVFDFN